MNRRDRRGHEARVFVPLARERMTMTRPSHRPLAVLFLAAALVAYVGCNSGSNSTGVAPPAAIPAPGDAADAGASRKPGNKLFADWPKSILGALLISGEQD